MSPTREDLLTALKLRPSYRKGQNDIANEFFLPCMARAREYDRAVAFFRSTVYSVAWSSLRAFIRSGGTIRIICSPILSEDDSASLQLGYTARSEQEFATRLESEIEALLEEPQLEKPTRILSALVAMGRLEFKVAYFAPDATRADRRIFHDKLGIFRDRLGATVVFKGSMNESRAGLAPDGNLESVDVFLSWADEREAVRVAEETTYFTQLWSDSYPSVRVRPFPEAVRRRLVRIASESEWEELVETLLHEMEKAQEKGLPTDLDELELGGLRPYPHQSSALRNWRDLGRRGLLKHATGSGKTFTAICAICYSLERGEIPLVVVPSRVLFEQWHNQLTKLLPDVAILLCGAGHGRWKDRGLLRKWTRPGAGNRLVLATVDTAATDQFRKMIRHGEHLFLVADEVHTLGSEKRSRLLGVETGPRLGLSATPERFGDPEGTTSIFEYFSQIIQPEFGIADAIAAGRLVPYMYYPHAIPLTDAEQTEWDELSRRIAQAWSSTRRTAREDGSKSEYLKRLLIQRADIAKSAEGKTRLAGELLEREWGPDNRWIVYCNSVEQLELVREELRSRGLVTLSYHYEMEDDPRETLRYFETHPSVIVAIQCLDEGVDVPNATHALILASSRNPREFIQRRGRVLRTSPGKSLAHIHDAIVVPSLADSGSAPSLLEGELARGILFGRQAENPTGVAYLESIATHFGLDLEKVASYGFESD